MLCGTSDTKFGKIMYGIANTNNKIPFYDTKTPTLKVLSMVNQTINIEHKFMLKQTSNIERLLHSPKTLTVKGRCAVKHQVRL